MNIVCQLMTKNSIHLPMPGYQRHRLKSLADHDYLKMRLRSGRNVMVAAFIDDFQVLQIYCVGKFLYYSFLNHFFLN